MRKWRNRLVLAQVLAVVLVLCGVKPAAAQIAAEKVKVDPRPKSERLKEGRDLFLRDWKKQGKLNKTGDGLGPVYNAVSCVACHHQVREGGGGSNESNVDLLSLVPRRKSLRPTFSLNYMQQVRKHVHPGFNGRTSLILHKFGPEKPAKGKQTYAELRAGILGLLPEQKKQKLRQQLRLEGFEQAEARKIVADSFLLTREQRFRRINRIPVELTQRNTTALFGAGIIDSIPDSAILAAAKTQKRIRGISGRVPQTSTGAIGRFGWRGQTATLHDFVLGACANELGLEVPGQRQPGDPLLGSSAAGGQVFAGSQEKKNLDLTDQQCRSLTEYVANLPAPTRARKLSLDLSRRVIQGEKAFTAIGCATCHTPNLGPAKGLYSDLLLHDMGAKLADPLTAVPELTEKTAPGFSSGFGYYGGESLPQIAKITTNIRQEWRTPPLWGLADSAPYLHDGRAMTIEQAILMHGGEGAASAKRYARLKATQKDLVHLFLTSLVAPGSTTQPVGRLFGGGGYRTLGSGFNAGALSGSGFFPGPTSFGAQ